MYLRNADLSVYEEQIEGFLSDAIGHQLDVDGLFELRFGNLTHVTAEKITLSNTDWRPDPVIVSVGHFSVTVDLWSLVFGPLIIEDLEVRDVNILLERNAKAKANWVSKRIKGAGGSDSKFDTDRIAFKEVRLQNFQLSFRDPARRRPLKLSLEQLTISPDESNVLDLDLSGAINEIPLWADGKLGPWENFIDGKDITVDFDLTLGKVRFAVLGTIADLRTLSGIELSLGLTGPSIDRVAEYLGFPPIAEGEFAVDGWIRELDDGNQVRLEGKLGAIDIFLSGNIDRLISPEHLRFDFSLSGPNAKYAAEVFGIVGAKAVPYQISGDLKKDGARFELTNTRVLLGENNLGIDGWIDLEGPVPDGDVTVSASGPDFSVIGPFVGVAGMPSEAFKIDGRIRKSGGSWRFDDVEATVGDNRIVANGALGQKGSPDAEISFSVSGPDFSILKAMTGLQGLPARPFDISARVKPARGGVMLNDATGVFGDNKLFVDGVIGTGRGLTGTSLTVRASGPELENVALLTGVPYLPGGTFEVAGRIRIDGDKLHLNKATASAGGMNGTVSGTVSLGADPGEFDLDLAVNGPDLAGALKLDWLDRLSGETFLLQGRVNHRAGKYELHSVSASISDFEIDVDGDLVIADASGDIVLRAYAPDAEELRKLIGIAYLPDGVVSLSGRIEKQEAELEFTNVLASIGEYSLGADGTLSTAPLSNESDLEFSASGPELREIGLMFGYDGLPDRPFDVSGEINGKPTGFALEQAVAKIGDNNIDGSFTVDLRDKPEISGRISSSFLDLRQRLARDDAELTETDAGTSELLLSDEPLDAAWLDAANIDITVKTDRLILGHGDVHDFHIGVRLWDRVLDIDPVSFRESEGSVFGKLRLAPRNGVYDLDVSLNIDNMHVGLLASKDQERTTVPPIDGQLELIGTGRSLHEIMASSNGKVSLTQGKGRLKDLITSQLFGDLILQIIRILNPLQTAEKYTTLQCGIYAANIQDGVATIESLAIQTDRMVFIARGNVNFEDEKLNLTMRATPREGLGISIGGVANSFLRLGGTLRSPKLKIDPTSSITTTGAAVATGGLSIVAKGLWDRVKAQSDICKDRLQQQ